MSHFTKCDLKVTNLVALKRALEELGHKMNVAEQGQSVEVRGWKGAKMNADIGVVQAKDGTYELVADWWGIETTRGTTEKEFVEEVNQRYAYQRVLQACEEQGYEVEQQTDENGEINLVMKKWE
jgi:hypothetical protein